MKRAGLAGPHEHHVADVVDRVLSKIPNPEAKNNHNHNHDTKPV